jgi:leucyl-tRNA synthetase
MLRRLGHAVIIPTSTVRSGRGQVACRSSGASLQALHLHIHQPRSLIWPTHQRHISTAPSSTTTNSPSTGSSYVTTPIFYVNGRPHIGHAYTAVLADALTRTLRLTNPHGAHLMTGTDEHGIKVEDAARAAGHTSTAAFCDDISSTFRNVFDRMDIKYDQYLRTTQGSHATAVAALWKQLYDGGHIYMGKHEGWYCKADEAFVPENQVSHLNDKHVCNSPSLPLIYYL